MQFDTPLMGLCLLPIGAGGSDVIVTCAYDGTTYIVHQTQEIQRLDVHENITCFQTGAYQLQCDIAASYLFQVYFDLGKIDPNQLLFMGR